MLAAIAGSVMVVAGCAPSGGLAVDRLEEQLVALTLPDHPGLVSAVSCPDPLAPAAGDVVTCEVTIGTQTAPLEVTFGEGRGQVVQAAVAARLIAMGDVERTAAAELSQDLGQATELVCPQPVMVVEAGSFVRCVATDARGIERELLVTPGDDGSFTLGFGQ